MIAWLKARGYAAGDATALAVTGRRTRALPALAEAWQAGRLSQGQVRAVLANVRESHVNLFVKHEAELVPCLEGLSAADTATAMTQWRLKAEALDDYVPPKQAAHVAHLSQSLEGRWYLSGGFATEGGAVIDTAIRLVATDDWERIPAERRGDAIVEIFRWFLDNQDVHNGRRHRPHLNVIVDGSSLDGSGHLSGQLAEHQLPLDSATLNRLACDCAMHRVVRDSAGAIIDYGRATRTIPAPLWNALVLRDRHCRFPGCDRPPTWCEGHHVTWYSRGGQTNLGNLVMACSRHHHKMHMPGWDAQLEPDGQLVIRTARGDTLTTYPPGRQPRAA